MNSAAELGDGELVAVDGGDPLLDVEVGITAGELPQDEAVGGATVVVGVVGVVGVVDGGDDRGG